ncbi:MAG: hypothetical protein VKJ02_12555 [Snowella sp.]|nr:hypothetical protein [Snowella sp.]
MISLKSFKIWYFAGIFLSGLLTVIFSVNTNVSRLVWLVGVGHVCILAFLGFKMKEPKHKIAAGLRVQTSGYLHTLIGFCGALLQLQPQNLLETIKIPLSYALITSIIGWWFGGELVNEFHEEETNLITTEAQKIADELKSFSDILTVTHKKYVEKIANASEVFEENLGKVGASYERMLDTYEVQINRLNTKQSDLLNQLENYQKQFINSQNTCYIEMDNAIKTSIDSSYKLNTSVDSLIRSLSTKELLSITSNVAALNEQTKLASENMGKVANTSDEVAKYLDNSQVLIKELEKLLDLIHSARRTI